MIEEDIEAMKRRQVGRILVWAPLGNESLRIQVRVVDIRWRNGTQYRVAPVSGGGEEWVHSQWLLEGIRLEGPTGKKGVLIR